MATLEDKILGEKLEYYCSSDEENAESDNDEYADAEDGSKNEAAATAPLEYRKSDSTSNTGPKGVIKDWQRFKQLEAEKRQENEKERIALAQKFSLTCGSSQDQDDPELAELLSDNILLEFTQKRMQELMAQSATTSKFGSVVHLKTGEAYLDAIDKEKKAVTVIVHVFDESNTCCRVMNACLEELSHSHPTIKFCKLSASVAGLSRNFKDLGVPALLIYKEGELIGNFVQLGEEFGDEFTSNDVENFLLEIGIILDFSMP